MKKFPFDAKTAVGSMNHLAFHMDEAELEAALGRLKDAGGPVLEEGQTTCCYAQSEKSWIADPQGVVWETFHTVGESVDYGQGPELAQLVSANAAPTACCAPQMGN